MNEMQWDEKHYSELTGQPHPDITRYLDTRHLPAPKSSTPPPVQAEKPAPVVTLGMIRWGIGGSFTAAVYCVCALAEQGAFKLAGAALAWIVLPAVGIGLAWVVLRACFTWSPAKSAPAQGGSVPPNDGGKWEWYQEQRQGWRKI